MPVVLFCAFIQALDRAADNDITYRYYVTFTR